MPDWTYIPLRRPMRLVFGRRRSLDLALKALALVGRAPGGAAVIESFGRTRPRDSAATTLLGRRLRSPVGASIPISHAADAVVAMEPLGAGLIEVTGVRPRDADLVHRIASGTRMAIVVSAAVGGVDGVLSHAVLRNPTPDQVKALSESGRPVIASVDSPLVGDAVALLAAGAAAVVATPRALEGAGPAWFQRVTLRHQAEATVPTRKSRSWISGLLFGLGMIGGGVGATVVALGPVLLPYDSSYLGLDATGLRRVDPQLVHFLQHDRITLAGTMVALGVMYCALSMSGMRRGHVWARDAMLASGVVGFPTLFYFFAYGYVEPVHVALAATLFPLFLIAVWRRPAQDIASADGDDEPAVRTQALIGQLLMIANAVGLISGGVAISAVGLTSVFVPSDLGFMTTTANSLSSANDRLVGFIAHDRAGFGGALISAGVVILLTTLWGWQRAAWWVWWALLVSAVVGFGAAIAVHFAVGYVDFWHLLPVYAGSAASAIALGLGRRYLTKPIRMERAMGIEPT